MGTRYPQSLPQPGGAAAAEEPIPPGQWTGSGLVGRLDAKLRFGDGQAALAVPGAGRAELAAPGHGEWRFAGGGSEDEGYGGFTNRDIAFDGPDGDERCPRLDSTLPYGARPADFAASAEGSRPLAPWAAQLQPPARAHARAHPRAPDADGRTGRQRRERGGE